MGQDERLRRLAQLERELEARKNEVADLKLEHEKLVRRLLKELDLRLLVEVPDHPALRQAQAMAHGATDAWVPAGTDRAPKTWSGSWPMPLSGIALARQKSPRSRSSLETRNLSPRQAVHLWELGLVTRGEGGRGSGRTVMDAMARR